MVRATWKLLVRAARRMLASVYVRACQCRRCACTDNDGCSARCIWPTGFWIRGCASLQIIHVNIENACISVSLNPHDPFHWCAHYLIGSNPWRTQFILSCWWVIAKCPASYWKCACYCFTIVISFLTVRGPFLLCAHLVIDSYKACCTHVA